VLAKFVGIFIVRQFVWQIIYVGPLGTQQSDQSFPGNRMKMTVPMA